MLKLSGVTKVYKTKGVDVKALNDVSITFPSSGLVFINGKSGCGKTTLLNVIGGLDGIDEGEIFVQDKKLSGFSASDYDAYRNTFIGFIFQEYNLLPEFSVEKNIKLAMELQGQDIDEDAFEKLLKDVEIEELKERKISELSGGQRQRVAIARALVKQPRIIMADEPTGALDLATGIQVLDILKKLSKDKLIIVVSHDLEFAEKYADRIIYLVDGRVEKDVSFVEKELPQGLKDNGEALFVREGAKLSVEEKETLANAVYERKKIEIIKNLNYREKVKTGDVMHDTQNPQALQKSKMKLRSAAAIGIKAVAVKPVRLFITVLISALAFAVFALFDTVANFNTSSVLKNQLKTSTSKTVVTTAEFVVDSEKGDSYDVKVSQDVINEMERKTSGKVKGIYNLSSNTNGTVKQSISIAELYARERDMVVGKRYYTSSTIGFIEFDPTTEIEQNGDFKHFNYKLISGEYPKLAYENGVLEQESMYQVAISTYLADSILYYLNGNSLGDRPVGVLDDLLGAKITLNQQPYTIVGVIDCGQIPEKYAELKKSTPYSQKTKMLLEDFDAYINTGAQKCLFAPKGFLNEYNKEHQSTALYYAGNTATTLSVEGFGSAKQTESYVYNAENYDAHNILLFDEDRVKSGEITLADDEIVIHHLHLLNLYATQISEITPNDRDYAKNLINDMDSKTASENRMALREWFALIKNEPPKQLKSILRQRFTQTGDKYEKEVKIVGVYFGIDPEDYTYNTRYKMMMNTNLMRELKVYDGQGDYAKMLFSARSTNKGVNVIANYFTREDGFTLNWYSNSVLQLIKQNEMIIHQVADLFLWVALALALFSVFMLYNYMSTSISSKKRSVGVLRGLGAGRKDILLAFLTESLFISAVNGVFANVFAVLGVNLVNKYILEIMNISVKFALFGLRQILIISVVSVLTGLLSSILPIFKIAKKKPVELIRLS